MVDLHPTYTHTHPPPTTTLVLTSVNQRSSLFHKPKLLYTKTAWVKIFYHWCNPFKNCETQRVQSTVNVHWTTYKTCTTTPRYHFLPTTNKRLSLMGDYFNKTNKKYNCLKRRTVSAYPPHHMLVLLSVSYKFTCLTPPSLNPLPPPPNTVLLYVGMLSLIKTV